MRKIIRGSRYDTDSAKKICSWANSWDVRSIDYVEETLYRTKAGKYFLHGIGGAHTPYAEPDGDGNWSNGELITPMTDEAAREFAEKHMDADDYEAAFGAVSEPIGITVQLPEALLEELDNRKGKASRSEVVIAALKAYFAGKE